MAEIDVVRCAECGLDITTQDGHYHLVDRYYHPECYDRKQAETTPRTIWARPPLDMAFASSPSSNASPAA